MALALKFQELLSEGAVRSHADLAKLGHVSRTRVCQILGLTNLAPLIQEALLLLPKPVRGRDRITRKPIASDRKPGRLGDAARAVSFLLRRVPTVNRSDQSFRRYTRSPSRSKERTFRPGFDRLREMKPRTVCACHPVSLRISFRVAPWGRDNSVQTWAALDPSRNTGRYRFRREFPKEV
jgi:hypothetical protein